MPVFLCRISEQIKDHDFLPEFGKFRKYYLLLPPPELFVMKKEEELKINSKIFP